jgi:hypothetical protein
MFSNECDGIEGDVSPMMKYIDIRTVPQKTRRKIEIVCAVSIFAAFLAWSHPWMIDALLSLKRRAEVRRMMNAYWHGPYFGFGSEIRGPLSIAQAERELFGVTEGTPEEDAMHVVTRRLQNTYFGEAWAKIKANHRDGDDLYFFRSDRGSWRHLNGRQGYVAVRKDEVLRCLVTEMN